MSVGGQGGLSRSRTDGLYSKRAVELCISTIVERERADAADDSLGEQNPVVDERLQLVHGTALRAHRLTAAPPTLDRCGRWTRGYTDLWWSVKGRVRPRDKRIGGCVWKLPRRGLRTRAGACAAHDERREQTRRRRGDAIHGRVERSCVVRRRPLEPAHLADVLEGGRPDLAVTCRDAAGAERLDAATHACSVARSCGADAALGAVVRRRRADPGTAL